jgi:Flp pilus assembly protein CpaB
MVLLFFLYNPALESSRVAYREENRMRRGRTLIFLLLILVVALGVAYVGFRALQQALTPRVQAPTNVQVFAAGQPIAQGGKITEDALTTITVPQDQVSAAEFTVDQKAQLVNKIAKFPLDQGVVITKSMVTDTSQGVAIAGPQWAALIPPGMTAISIPVSSRLSVGAYGISDGAHVNLNACMMFVDVDPGFQTMTPDNTATLTGSGLPKDALPILTLTVGPAGTAQGRLELEQSLPPNFYYLLPSEQLGQRPRVVCQTILQDVVVMKLGDFPLSSAATTPAPQAQAQQGAVQGPDIITLIVSPQDANTLAYMVYTNAKITMTLRNPADQSRQATEAATLQFLLSQYNIPIPAKLPYALQPRIDALAYPKLANDASPAAP